MMQKRNSRSRLDDGKTQQRKASLRLSLLQHLKHGEPIVMEVNGGLERMFDFVYGDIARGVMLETDPRAAERAAVQRPAWRVYENDAASALAAGIAADLPVNYLDVNTDDDPWPVLEAFFGSERQFPERLVVAVSDSFRRGLTVRSGWSVATMKAAREVFGLEALYRQYLEVARWNLERLAKPRGYRVIQWAGFYGGLGQRMSHFGALLEHSPAA